MKEWSRTWSIAISVVASVFLLVPVAIIIVMALSAGTSLKFPPDGFSTRWFEQFATDSRWRDAAVTSVVVGGIATLVATICGTGLALAVWRAPKRVGALIASFALAPAIMPVIVMAIALFISLSKFSLTGTRLGLGLSHGMLGMPIVFLVTAAALQYFDRSLLDASRSLGASTAYAWRTVLVPFLLPPVIVGAFLGFMTSFDEVVVALFVGGGTTVTLPNLIWQSLTIDLTPIVAAVSASALLAGLVLQALALVWLRGRLKRRRNAQLRAREETPAFNSAMQPLIEA